MRFLPAKWLVIVFSACLVPFAFNVLGSPQENEDTALEVVSFSGKSVVDLEKDIFWVVDPQSRRLRAPSQEEMVRIAPKHPLTRSTAKTGEVFYKDGSSGLQLPSGFEHMVLARKNAKGEMETACVTTMAQALDFLSGEVAKRREVTYDR